MRKKMSAMLNGLLMVVFMTQVVQAEDLSYDGGSELGARVMPEAAKAFEAKTGIKFKSINYALGSGMGLEAAMEGKIPLAGVSRALTPEEKKKVYHQIVGYDAIAVYVNEKNPVANLSKEQLKAIYKGRITNWKEVGWKDTKIAAVTESLAGKGATLKTFMDVILDGAEFGTIKEVDRSHNVAKYVGADESAIGYASLAFKSSKIKHISLDGIGPSNENVRSGAYPLSRPLLLVTQKASTGSLKKFFEFILSEDGQTIVGKTFVPVK